MTLKASTASPTNLQSCISVDATFVGLRDAYSNLRSFDIPDHLENKEETVRSSLPDDEVDTSESEKSSISVSLAKMGKSLNPPLVWNATIATLQAKRDNSLSALKTKNKRTKNAVSE